MRPMSKDKECIGKYATKRKAQEMARMETRNTGVKHHAFFTHYYCPYELENFSCWTVMLTQVNKRF